MNSTWPPRMSSPSLNSTWPPRMSSPTLNNEGFPLISSAVSIQTWIRNIKFHRNIRQRLLQDSKSIVLLISSITSDHDFNLFLDNEDFRASVRAILCALPNTSKYALGHLYEKLGKHKISYSVQILISAFQFSRSPEDLSKSFAHNVTDSIDACLCKVASKLLSTSIIKLLTTAIDEASPLKQFTVALYWYRVSLRFYFDCIDRLKTKEAEVMVSELCDSYSQLQHALQQLQQLPDDAKDKTSMISQTVAKFSLIKTMLINVKGGKKANLMMAEIDRSISEIYALPVNQPISPIKTSISYISEDKSHEDKETISRSLPSSSSAQTNAQFELLENRLSAIAAGGDSERLAHEICLNPNYRLPDPPASAFIDTVVSSGFEVSMDGIVRTVQPPVRTAVADSVKRFMMDVLADRMVCSMKTSPIEDISQLIIGQNISVALPEELPLRTFMTATIDSVNIDSNSIDVVFVCSKKKFEAAPFALVKLSSDPIDASGFILALEDLYLRISSFSKEGSMPKLDLQLINQMIQNRSMSIKDAASLLTGAFNDRLDLLLAPVRSSRLQKWTRMFLEASELKGSDFNAFIPLLPFFFEVTSAFIEELQRDMANYYISVLAPTLFKHGAELLASKFKKRILGVSEVLTVLTSEEAIQRNDLSEIYSRFLPLTTLSISTVLDGLVSVDGAYSIILTAAGAPLPHFLPPVAEGSIYAVACLRLLDLLKKPTRLTLAELPEVFAWDGERLADIRDDVDAIVLLACIGVSIKQVCSRFSISLIKTASDADIRDTEESLFHRLDILIRQVEARLMESVVAEACRYIEHILELRTRNDLASDKSPTPVDGTWKVYLRETIEANTCASNPIMALFTKRTYDLLLRGILNGPGPVPAKLLQQYSLSTRQQAAAVSRATGKARALMEHHFKVHKLTYEVLLQPPLVSR